MMLLTATATKEVRADIRRVLRYERNDALESFIGSFNRTNLIYRVHAKPDKIKDQMIAVAQDIHSHHTIDACGILYVTSRKDAETLADGLNTAGISSRPYHAGLSDERRHQTHLLWRSNQIRVITATIAFGMGIDKPDVRFVHHFCIPKSLENYMQESGRAGRDGHDARCVLWYKRKDVFRVSPMIHDSNAAALPKFYQFIRQFCEGTTSCRRSVLADAFGEGELFVPAQHCNLKCDFCLKQVPNEKKTAQTSIALYVLDVLSVLKTEGIKQDVTFSQLCDTARNVGTLWKSISTNTSHNPSIAQLKVAAAKNPKMPATTWEKIIMTMMLNEVLVEGFIATSYSFTSYMRVNMNEKAKLINGDTIFVVSEVVDGGAGAGGAAKKKKVSKKKSSTSKKSESTSTKHSPGFPVDISVSAGSKRKRNERQEQEVFTIDSSTDDDDDFE